MLCWASIRSQFDVLSSRVLIQCLVVVLVEMAADFLQYLDCNFLSDEPDTVDGGEEEEDHD